MAALSQVVAITGLGGIGKTQTAVEYAYRYRNDYAAVFWVKAELREELMAGFGEIAKVLKLPEKDAQDQSLTIAAVKEWFKTHERWLLIFDNADDLTVAWEFLPSSAQGHVLLTTRAAATGQIAQAVELKKMSHHDGALFLLRRAKRIANQGEWETATEADRQVALEIAKEMDGLPLALDQAGAFVEEMMLSLTEYLSLYHQEGAKLLAERGELATDDHPSVTVTFRLAFAKVQERSQAAADLLRVCAFLAPDDIPEEIFTVGASVFAEPLRTVAANALDFAKVVREAGRFSLIERRSSTQNLTIHRLVQEVLRSEMEEVGSREGWLEQTIKTVNQVFPDIEFKNWPLCDRLISHVIVLVNAETVDVCSLVEIGFLFNRAGMYLQQRGQYALAATLLSRSLVICEQYIGQDHPNFAPSLNCLASCYHHQGRYPEAESLYLKSLHIQEQQLGSDHFDISQNLNSLAALYESQGRYSEAELLNARALSIREQHLGTDHPDLATCLNNRAKIYRAQGFYSEAEQLYLRALCIREKHLDSDHPDVATSLNNLAATYCSQGRYAEAEQLYLRALCIREKHLGPDHPNVATSLNNLAELYQSQERHDEAEPLLVRSLSIQEKQLGSDHPDVATSLNNLSTLYQSQERYDEAEILIRRALSTWERQLGANHPDVAKCLNNLAVIYHFQGNYSASEKHHKRALFIREKEFGTNHPDVAHSLYNIANLYNVQERFIEAEPLYIRAVSILFKSLGQEHPNSKRFFMNFFEFLFQVVQKGQQAGLSNHPWTQNLLAQIRPV